MKNKREIITRKGGGVIAAQTCDVNVFHYHFSAAIRQKEEYISKADRAIEFLKSKGVSETNDATPERKVEQSVIESEVESTLRCAETDLVNARQRYWSLIFF